MATTNYSWNLPTVGGSEDTWGTQLNQNWTALDTLLGGVTALEFSRLDGLTATTAELNILDGVTATTAEINKLDGVTWNLTAYNTLTASASELNILDGATVTTTELNYLDGVTGNIQTQIDGIIAGGGANNSTITITAGDALTGGGAFTLNQSFNEAITLNHADTSSQSSVNNSGSVYIQDITLDAYGHVTGITSTTVPAPAALSTASGSAPSYSARAWGVVNSSGAFVAGQNVASTSGTSPCTVTFSTPMQDSNYAVVMGGFGSSADTRYSFVGTKSASSFTMGIGVNVGSGGMWFAVFR